MQLSFIYPAVLWFLLLLPILWGLTIASHLRPVAGAPHRDRAPTAIRSSQFLFFRLALRSIIVLVLVLALA
ncbi:MAG: hypothetical protein HC876_22780, partial [Chloroflexaceae bacterium]|nr:hypothetical protein [Chloroflexaceae bacterium]